MDRQDGPFKARRILIRLIGIFMLGVGLINLILAPLEIHVLTFFTEGGRFEYEGFGYGSLMFGNIVAQVFGYYLIALICIPLGIGHLRMRSWARRISLTLLYDWLVLGLPLTIIVFAILLSTKDLPPESLPLLIIGFLLLYPLLPLLLTRFYNWRDIELTFSENGFVSELVKNAPQPILVLGSLMLFYALALHVPILFNGLFPLFGVLLHDFPGIIAIDLSVVIMLLLTWGVFKQQRWAWWGSAMFLVLLITSATITFLSKTPQEIFENVDLALLEQDILQNVPLESAYFLFLFVLPLIITLVLLFVSRRYFTRTFRGR